MVPNESSLDSIIEQFETQTFRSFRIVGVDIECTTSQQAYCNWSEDQKQFVFPEIPTHANCIGKLARWISMANPYGLVTIIDCAKISLTSFAKFENFLKDPNTIVTMFGAYEDLWSLHLTFGKIIPGTENLRKFSKNLRKNGVFGNLRVFDLKNVIDLTINNVDEILNYDNWQKAGIICNGQGLWHLAEATLALNIFDFDLKVKPHEWAFLWNVREIPKNRIIYVTLDALTTVHSFMALFRVNLIPSINNLMEVFPSDVRSTEHIFKLSEVVYDKCQAHNCLKIIENEIHAILEFSENPENFPQHKFPGYLSTVNEKPKSFIMGIFPDMDNFKLKPTNYKKMITKPLNELEIVFKPIIKYDDCIKVDFSDFTETYTQNEQYKTNPWYGFPTFTNLEHQQNTELDNLVLSIKRIKLSKNLWSQQSHTDSLNNVKFVDPSSNFTVNPPTVSPPIQPTAFTGNMPQPMYGQHQPFYQMPTQSYAPMHELYRALEEKGYYKRAMEEAENRARNCQSELDKLKSENEKLKLENEALKTSRNRSPSVGTLSEPVERATADSRKQKFADDAPKLKVTITNQSAEQVNTSKPKLKTQNTKWLVDFSNPIVYNQPFYKDNFMDGRLNPRFERVQTSYEIILRKAPDTFADRPQIFNPPSWRRLVANSFGFWLKTLDGDEAQKTTLGLLQALALQLQRKKHITEHDVITADKTASKFFAEMQKVEAKLINNAKQSKLGKRQRKASESADQPGPSRHQSATSERMDATSANNDSDSEPPITPGRGDEHFRD